MLGDVVQHGLDEVQVFFDSPENQIASLAQYRADLSSFVAVVNALFVSRFQFPTATSHLAYVFSEQRIDFAI